MAKQTNTTATAYDRYEKKKTAEQDIPTSFDVLGRFNPDQVRELGELVSRHKAKSQAAIPAEWLQKSDSISTTIRSEKGIGRLNLTNSGEFSYKAPRSRNPIRGHLSEVDEANLPEPIARKLHQIGKQGWYRYWVGIHQAARSYRSALQAFRDNDSRQAGWHFVQMSSALAQNHLA